MNRKIIYSVLCMWYLLSANTTFAYTHADTLRGSNGRGREWWDVQQYELNFTLDTATKSISGTNRIRFSIVKEATDSMQIDLQDPLSITEIMDEHGDKMSYTKEGNVWWVKYPFHTLAASAAHYIDVSYKGVPRVAVTPPWDGGISWMHDSTGKPWIAVSCQGLGASVWWPCKDAQWDEPDNGMEITISMKGRYSMISNGSLMEADTAGDKPVSKWHWEVKDPINNYDATFYIGDYVHWQDTLMGEKGVLNLNFWVLRYNEARARKQFAVVKQMIHAYEYWMGPYPFYKDGYKLVEAPYLGMEHQGAIAYGNKYKMGYLGYDRTTSGYGMDFDYIIIHESGHEWFGNNITAKDIADNWIHEGITTYSEALFIEYTHGKEKGMKYCRGMRSNIANNKPIIGDYGVNNEGSEDMYDKGANIMYMIRVLTNDDEKFRAMLRGLGKDFYHQTVTTKQIEDYIMQHTGLGLTAFFNQYLRTTDIPQLAYHIANGKLNYRFTNVVKGFSLPIAISTDDEHAVLNPTTEWQQIEWHSDLSIKFTNDFLIKTKKSK